MLTATGVTPEDTKRKSGAVWLHLVKATGTDITTALAISRGKGRRSWHFAGAEIPFGKLSEFDDDGGDMVQRCDCASCHRTRTLNSGWNGRLYVMCVFP